MNVNFNHATVLLNQTVDALDVKPGGLYIDCTVGGAGHSLLIAQKGGRLLCFDVDPAAIAAAEQRLAGYPARVVNDNFANMANHLSEGDEVAGIVMDCGVSSVQLDTLERGFSFHQEDAVLDMRMGDSGLSAYDVVNDYSEDKLRDILYKYGGEKYARSIVRGVAQARQTAPIKTTGELAEIIRCNVPLSVRRAKNPCRKTFQAIRMEVNQELENLEKGIDAGFAALSPGGRFAIISFHSGECSLVKSKFAEFAAGCDCPRSLPLCVCGKSPRAVHITRKPIVPDAEELDNNRRSRSAKLRVLEKL